MRMNYPSSMLYNPWFSPLIHGGGVGVGQDYESCGGGGAEDRDDASVVSETRSDSGSDVSLGCASTGEAQDLSGSKSHGESQQFGHKHFFLKKKIQTLVRQLFPSLISLYFGHSL